VSFFFAHGALSLPAADFALTTYTVTCTDVGGGGTFQPKALMIYTVSGLASATDAVTETPSARDVFRVMAFATSTSNRGFIQTSDRDNAASMTTTASTNNTFFFNSGQGQYDLDAMLSTGFRLIKDSGAVAHDATVFWLAWGGTDITVANTQFISEPAAAGTQTYGVTGFTTGATDQVVLLAVCQATSTAGGGVFDSGFCLGFMTGADLALGQVVVAGNQDEGSASGDTDGYCQTGQCLAMIAVGGGNPTARAVGATTTWVSNGFALNWTRAVTGRQYIVLAMKGGQWAAGSYTINNSAVNNTATVSTLAFAPVGLIVMGRPCSPQWPGRMRSAQERWRFITRTVMTGQVLCIRASSHRMDGSVSRVSNSSRTSRAATRCQWKALSKATRSRPPACHVSRGRLVPYQTPLGRNGPS
jgi:hypothetical protein